MWFQIYQDEEKKWRWRLCRGNNDNIIAVSGQGHAHKRDCVDEIEWVKQSTDTRIDEI